MNNPTRLRAIRLIAASDDPNNLFKTFSIILNHTRILPGFDRELETILKREFVRVVDALIVEARERNRQEINQEK